MNYLHVICLEPLKPIVILKPKSTKVGFEPGTGGTQNSDLKSDMLSITQNSYLPQERDMFGVNILGATLLLTKASYYLLLNLRSPRDCGSCRSRLWYFLSLLDGASVREAHCAQASTAVRRTEAPCAQASTVVREAHCAQATGRPV